MLYLAKLKKKVKQKFMSAGHEERYVHTLGVVKMAKTLAKWYQVPKPKAIIAALFHDFCKYDSDEEITELLCEKDQAECEAYPVLKHSYASAEYYKKYIGKDQDIYQAIRNHVFGRIDMSRLEEIILISDYTGENRTYENCKVCREILQSKKFYKAIYFSTKKTIEFLEKQQLKPHPTQLEVLKYYEGLCEK